LRAEKFLHRDLQSAYSNNLRSPVLYFRALTGMCNNIIFTQQTPTELLILIFERETYFFFRNEKQHYEFIIFPSYLTAV
jgi:hypothetical protein